MAIRETFEEPDILIVISYNLRFDPRLLLRGVLTGGSRESWN